MKKIIITNYKEFGDQPENKTLVVIGEKTMEAQDGYHTFGELYEHRITLFIALAKKLYEIGTEPYVDGSIWRSKLHHDGTCFEGWFILGIRTDKGKQITYHLPMSKWEETNFAQERGNAPEWDGHTPNDVLERIKNL